MSRPFAGVKANTGSVTLSAGGNQRVLARGNWRPAARLRLGRLAEALVKPLADERVKELERHTSLKRVAGCQKS